AADGAAVPDLRVADLARRLGDEDALLRDHWVADEIGVPRQRSDRDGVSLVPDVAEVVEAADVDEQRRPREPHAQERDQRVAAGEELGVLAAEKLDRLADRPRPRVVEGGRDHGPAPAADFTARTMFS